MLSIRRHLIATTILAAAMATPAAAQAAGQAASINVPAQEVTSAVRQFARQAGVQIVVSGSVARGRRTHAISGRMSTGEALSRMLEGTGLAAKATGENSWVIVSGSGAPDPAPASYEADAGGTAIIVTGAMAAQREAVAEKRNADNTVETLHANDVGKLPDQNVAEAIKRLPGVTAANDQGEGRYAVIRGIDPGLANVTLNGMTLPAPEPDGRQVKLDDLPSAMIQAVTVSKSL
ncbi:MAG TPA: TonB-dependent receptor plug domain-containing protein, partial [Novosphingobium sp.]|nr:TonB-dependent receptor plug domain-containing protein [Novosphingobium sp.]